MFKGKTQKKAESKTCPFWNGFVNPKLQVILVPWPSLSALPPMMKIAMQAEPMIPNTTAERDPKSIEQIPVNCRISLARVILDTRQSLWFRH